MNHPTPVGPSRVIISCLDGRSVFLHAVSTYLARRLIHARSTLSSWVDVGSVVAGSVSRDGRDAELRGCDPSADCEAAGGVFDTQVGVRAISAILLKLRLLCSRPIPVSPTGHARASGPLGPLGPLGHAAGPCPSGGSSSPVPGPRMSVCASTSWRRSINSRRRA